MIEYALGALVVVIILYARTRYETVSVLSDGVRREWKVVGGYDNSREAAIAMSKLHTRLMTFFNVMKTRYHINATDQELAESLTQRHTNEGSWTRGRALIENMLDNYDPDALYENDARINGGTSWTNNKGDSMYMCMRKHSDPSQIENHDISFFVLLHECAHIANKASWGHDDQFWRTFKFVLQQAESSGVFTNTDYSMRPVNFCGLHVAYNPYFDTSLAPI